MPRPDDGGGRGGHDDDGLQVHDGHVMAPGPAMRIAPRSAAETALTGSSGEERSEVHRLNKREGTRFRRRG